MKKVLLLISALALSGTINAQSDKRDAVVNVENGYTPVVIEVGKKDFTPSTDRKIDIQQSKAEFSKVGIIYKGFTSEIDNKDALPKQERVFPGYARLGYGVTNDIDAKVAYRHVVGKNGALNAYSTFDGFKCNIGKEADKWNSRFFNNSTGLGYVHKFNKLKINADASFSNNVFNYHCPDTASAFTDKQNSRNYTVSFGGVSTLTGPVSYKFDADYGYITRSYAAGAKNGIGEHSFGFGGSIAYNMDSTKLWNNIYNKSNRKYKIFDSIAPVANIDLRLDAFMYNQALKNGYNGYGDYVSIDINPSIAIPFYKWTVNVGFNMNFVSKGAMICAIAPNISTEKNLNKHITVYGGITGGRDNNSLAKLEKLAPYWGIADSCATRLKPTYRVVDLEFGSRLSFKSISANIHTGYVYTKDDLLQVVDSLPMIYSNFKQGNTHNVYVAARLGYNFRRWVRVSADIRYDFWDCKSSRELLMMKPELTTNIIAEGRIDINKKVEYITVQLGYNYTHYTKAGELGRITDKHDLYARVGCQISKRFSAYIQGNNLTNDKHYEYAGYLARGIRGELGATLNF